MKEPVPKLTYNRLNAAYYACPHTDSHLLESKLDKGTSMAKKWGIKCLK